MAQQRDLERRFVEEFEIEAGLQLAAQTAKRPEFAPRLPQIWRNPDGIARQLAAPALIWSAPSNLGRNYPHVG